MGDGVPCYGALEIVGLLLLLLLLSMILMASVNSVNNALNFPHFLNIPQSNSTSFLNYQYNKIFDVDLKTVEQPAKSTTLN